MTTTPPPAMGSINKVILPGEGIKEILKQVYEVTQKINRRFSTVHSADDFIGSEAGMEKLDSICMLLIAIGESIKNMDRKINNELLSKYPNTEWKK